MKITYIAKRHRNNEYICHDVIADGVYLNLFMTGGEPIEIIAQRTQEWLDNPFPENRTNDSISVIMGSLDAEKPDDAIPVFPEGKPSMQWKAVEMQNYLGAYGIDYGDKNTKAEMLLAIKEHYIKAAK